MSFKPCPHLGMGDVNSFMACFSLEGFKFVLPFLHFVTCLKTALFVTPHHQMRHQGVNPENDGSLAMAFDEYVYLFTISIYFSILFRLTIFLLFLLI